MTRREHVRRALSFQPTDRPPLDLGSSRVTGVAAWGLRSLRQSLGLGGGREVRVYDLSQFLAEVEPDILDALGCDFCPLPLQVLPLELPRAGWKPYTFWDGQTFLVPDAFHPTVGPDGTLRHGYGHPWQTVERRMPPGCRYFERVHLGEIDSADFEIPHVAERDWRLPEPFTEEYSAARAGRRPRAVRRDRPGPGVQRCVGRSRGLRRPDRLGHENAHRPRTRAGAPARGS